MKCREKKIHNLKELKQFAQQVVQEIKVPQLILMEGPLGVGKTQCVRFMSEYLGVSEKDICSPSFSLINTYKTKELHIAHIDLFRLQDKQDLESTGVWDVFLDSQIIFVEWANLLRVKWPDRWNKLIIIFEFSKSKSLRTIKWGSY